MLKNGLARICGIQPGYEGLNIKPALPSSWNKVSIKRVFRGAEFNIEIVKGKKNKIIVNGKESSLPTVNIEPETSDEISLNIL